MRFFPVWCHSFGQMVLDWIVVNHARSRLGQSAIVTVSSALQTSAGRLIFAELKNAGAAGRPHEPAKVRARNG